MNKHLYRIVFNERRGQLMVVAETASSDGKSAADRRPGKRPAAPYRATLRALSCALFAALGLPSSAAQAQIVAYRGAPGNRQPTVLNAGTGVPLVNIQTPSAAGVSRNSYSQFDVQPAGAILNNSRSATPTQLGGWVAGNPWLATGSARVILNQVTSANPSLLQGYVEVAGSGAQVVIANPAGVSCAGCGFINTNRVTLTTGTPIINGGNLDGYRVEGGTLRVEGAGLDASRVTQTDLIARAVQINAGLWANALHITTGANQVDAEHTVATPIPGGGGTPVFALDVAQLGGMYAGKITLVGTETGVGVRNAGTIGASVGEVRLSADGRLHNSGRITSSGPMQIDSGGGIDNSGTIYAQADALVNTRGNIENAGTIAAQGHATLFATGAGSHVNGTPASLLAAGLNPDGSLAGSARLTVGASEQIAMHGQAIASGDQSLRAGALDLSDSQIRSDNLILTATNGHLDARRSVLSASGTLSASAAQSLLHDNAHSDARQLQLAAHDISNVHGELLQTGGGDTSITLAGEFNNAHGRLASNSGKLALAASAIDNSAGVIGSQGDIRIAAQSLRNAQGQISTGQTLQIAASQTIDNTQGLLAADGQLKLNSNIIDNSQGTIASVNDQIVADAGSGALNNARGRIEAAQDIALSGIGMSNADGVIVGQNLLLDSRQQTFDNTRGTLAAGRRLDLQSGALSNDGGLIQANGVLIIDTHGQKLSNRDSGASGGILGQATVKLSTGGLDNTASFVGAKGPLAIASDEITNTAGGSLSSEQEITLAATRLDNRNGQIQSLGATTLSVGDTVDNRGGLIRSGQSLDISANSVINRGSSIEGQALSIAAQRIDNRSGALRAKQTLTLRNGGAIDNSGGLISSAETLQILDPKASEVSNSAGKTLVVTNRDGTLIADRRLSVDSASLSGDGSVLSQGDLAVKLLADFTHTGQFAANGNATLETAGSLTNRAVLKAGKRLDVRAAHLDNEASGEIVATALRLTATDRLSNRGLIDGTDTVIDSVTLNNLGTGRIYGDKLSIAATTLTNDAENVNDQNAAPVIAARQRLDIGANVIVNREHALLFSAGDLAIGGTLDASRYASGQGGTLDNSSASIEALGNIAINAGQISNTNAHFSTRVVALNGESIVEYQGSGAAKRYLPGAPGVYVHNDESDQLMTPEGNYETWLRYDYTRSATETQVLSSDPGKILAGGAMALTATTLLNSDSQIIAGGSLSGAIGMISNSETPGERTITDVGAVTSFWRHRKRGRDSTGSSAVAYNPPDTIVSISLGSALYQQNAAPNGSGATPSNVAIGQVSQNAVAPLATSASVGSGQAVARLTQVPALIGGRNGQAMVVRSVTPNIALPDNSLFRTSPTTRYLVETDPRFTNNRQWSSSDYLLSALSVAPATTQKRLGDGFYEQRLIREQIAELTGRRFLDGYASDEEQYRALMDASSSYAKTWQLIPGVALSAEQMAQLTSDIVWLVEKEIALTDGQTIKALVPQVYARVQDGDLAASGALIAANDIDLRLSGDLTNSGTIAGRQLVTLSAENIGNLGGRISGRQTLISARNDLTNLGGTLAAEDRLIASAGRNLTVETTTRTQGNAQGSRTNIDRIAGLHVTGSDGTLVAAAGNDLTLIAAAISNATPATFPGTAAGTTLLVAGRDLTLGTVTQAASQRIVWDGNNTRSDSQRSEVGTTVRTTGDLSLQAGRDVSARAASVTSDYGALSVLAGNDIAITAGQARSSVDEAHQHSEKGVFSRTTRTTRDTLDATSALVSTFSGDTVFMQAGRDLLIRGSNVVASGDATLLAGNNLNIEAATETRKETHFIDVKQRGIFGSGGVGFTIGSMQASTDQQTQATTAAASTVGSTDGNVLMHAANAYRQVGSDVIATQGSIGITAKKVDILEARETSRTIYETKAKQSGLTIAITSPVISAVQTAQQMTDAASDTRDPRMKLLAAASTALAAKSTYDDVKAGQGTTIDGKTNQMPVTNDQGEVVGSRDATAGERVGGINLSISIGSSSSSSKTTLSSDSAAVSTLAAGQDIKIVASGAGKDSDLTTQGANLAAGKQIALKADDEIRLLAARNSAEQHSSNKNSSASVGFSIGTNGPLFNVGASAGRGNADGSDTLWSNTHFNAGHTLSIESGGDTTLRGALARGEQVIAKVGAAGQGNLLIESLQDVSTYDSKQQSAGFSVSLGLDRIGGSLSYSQSKIRSDYANVGEQSGIKAGDGGFQVEVKGDTTLNGAVIASTQNAVDSQRNSFATGGTLTTRDVENRADYSASGTSVNLGSGVSFDGKLTPGGTGAGLGKDSGSASSTTMAGISEIAGNQAVRSGDAETGIAKIFDADEVQKEIEAQAKITQQFGQLASKAVGDYATSKHNEGSDLRAQALTEKDPQQILQLKAQARKLDSEWGDHGTLRLAAHTLIGGLTGELSGAAGAAAGTLSAPLFSEYIKEAEGDGALAATLTVLASTATGAAIGGAIGAGTALNEAVNNYVYHYKGRIIAYDKNDNDKLIELSEKDFLKLAAQNPNIFTQLIVRIGTQAEPILVLDTSSELMTDSRIVDLGNPADKSQIAKESNMGYKNLTDQATRIYVQTGMNTAPSDAEQSANALSGILGQPVGYINNGTEGLPDDVGEYLPDSISKRDVLNEFTYRTLDGKGPTLIVLYSAGNEDARKALQLGALYGHRYDNLSFLSIASPVSDSTLKTTVGQGGAQYPGQVNDWKDPITYSKTAGVVSIGSFLGGIGFGAVQGCAAGASSGPLGCIFAGGTGAVAGAVAGGIPFVAGYLSMKRYHLFEQYIAKPQTQTLLFDWIKANPPAPAER